MFRRLRVQLTAWYLSILALVLTIFGAGTLLISRTIFLNSLDDANRRALAPIVESFAKDDDSLVDLIHELSELTLDKDEHLALLTTRGKVLYARGVQLDPEPPLRQGGSHHEGGPNALRLYVTPLEQHGVIKGHLRIGRSLAGPIQTMRVLALTMGAMIPLALLIAWTGGTLLAAHAVRPVEEAMSRERQFTRDASHELRTPLAVILSQAQLALEHPELPAPVRGKLEVVIDTARKMGTLVADLLTLGRGDAGIQGPMLRLSLADLVEEEVEAMEAVAHERGKALELIPPTDGAWIDGDPGRLGQLVRNLLDNALRYGTAPLRVRVSTEGDAVRLAVSNAGTPLTAADQKQLFDRFYRAESGRALNPEGTGLGLAIARTIARAHGGDLTVQSNEQETRFTLRLPRASTRA